jgi:hypothetical protein
MKTLRLTFLISLGVSLICMSAAFLSLGGWSQTAIGLFMGMLWGVLTWKGLRTYSFVFYGLLALLVFGAASNLPAAWLLGSLVPLLAAWDLSEFMAHLASFEPSQVGPWVIRHHLSRLLAVSGVGFALGGVALVIRVRLGFEAALLIGVLVFLGLAGMVRFLRRSL